MHLDLPGHSGIIWMHPGCSQEPPRKRPESREHPGGTRETLTRDPETLRILISEATIQDPGPKMCVQMYVYLCTYIFLYVCICIHIYIYIYIYLFLNMYLHVDPGGRTLEQGSWILGAGAWIQEHGSRTTDPGSLDIGLRIQAPEKGGGSGQPLQLAAQPNPTS